MYYIIYSALPFSPQEAFEHPLQIHHLRCEKFSDQVMEEIEEQVQSVQVRAWGMYIYSSAAAMVTGPAPSGGKCRA